jgi:hypothetical protein
MLYFGAKWHLLAGGSACLTAAATRQSSAISHDHIWSLMVKSMLQARILARISQLGIGRKGWQVTSSMNNAHGCGAFASLGLSLGRSCQWLGLSVSPGSVFVSLARQGFA